MSDYEFYKNEIVRLSAAENQLLKIIDEYRNDRVKNTGENPVEYCKARIKSSDSMKDKLARRNLPETLDVALNVITDAVGIRLICNFMNDVYDTADYLKARDEFEVVKIKDYIKNPKPNGYRSYHIIVKMNGGEADGILCEIQIRTIAIDCWASLEHQMSYKHTLKHKKLIESELKRCADEIASTDLSMQTIRELILADD